MYSQADQTPVERSNTIKLHDEAAFSGMRAAGKLAAECLDMLVPHMVPGAITDDLDKMAREFVIDRGALPACLFYRGYTKTLCISTNHVVCHGIPSPKTLKTGDIANVDVTVIVDGWHGDTSRMFAIGEIKRRAQLLIDTTYEALMIGIKEVKPGATLGCIGAAIQEYAEARRYSVVRDFCGHGLGRVFHDAPNVLHYGNKGEGTELREGMFFTIEPMLNFGKPSVKILSDGWTAVTRDKSLSAQFEHSIGVTATGAEIFTLSPAGLHNPTA
ncbi:MAG: type I methionyl aminopeptidase [Robiginitomaculum sp.]|nr:type I methionyl aminopeptidase [Robiginitomaculum sp.]MBL4617592.1 type I methionyl aminopeptidase [Robiginitomaculum sp.]